MDLQINVSNVQENMRLKEKIKNDSRTYKLETCVIWIKKYSPKKKKQLRNYMSALLSLAVRLPTIASNSSFFFCISTIMTRC